MQNNLTTTINPYWDAIKNLDVGHALMRDIHAWGLREQYCVQYCWAIPDPESLQFVAGHLGSRAVEMGAGTGYWAGQLSQMGIDIVCFDIAPPDSVYTNTYHSPCGDRQEGDYLHQPVKTYHPIEQGGPEVLTHFSDRSLFLCWPPYDNDMATQCLKFYSGKRLVYIGESKGGCNGDDEFFAALGRDWEEVASHRIQQWDGIHDWITVYERIERS